MSLLKGIIEPINATGDVKEMYDIIKNKYGFVPNSVKMHSINPFYIKQYNQLTKYFVEESSLSNNFRLIANEIISNMDKSKYCISLLKNILTNKLNLTNEEIDIIIKDPMKAPLKKGELLLLSFILKVLNDSNSTTQYDIDKLYNIGFSDVDIFDALNFATQMQKIHIMINALKIQKD